MEKTVSIAERERIHGIKNKIQEALLILETCFFLDKGKLVERLKLLQAKLLETREEFIKLDGRDSSQKERRENSHFDLFNALNGIFSPLNRQVKVEIQRGICYPPVRGNPLDFQMIIENLVLNAFEAGAKNITIRIIVENNSEIGIIISDDGDSISNEDLPFIFLPGYSTKKKGMGMGLYQVWKAVVENGWRIRVVPLEKGTKFILSLPKFFQSSLSFIK